MHIRSGLSGLRAENVKPDPEMSLLLMLGVGKVCVWRVENEVFSKFGGLGRDFYEGTHEAKMFGMHIGSVLSGLDVGNVNTNRWVWRRMRGVKNDDFSMFGDLGGDFCKAIYEAKLLGMHIGSVLSGLYAENVNTDPKMLI